MRLKKLWKFLEDVEVLSDSEFRLGESTVNVRTSSFRPVARRHRREVTPLRERLLRSIYQRFHCGLPGQITAAASSGEAGHDGSILEALIAANQGRCDWSLGWKVQTLLADGQVVAEKGPRLRRWLPGQYICETRPGKPACGDQLKVSFVSGSAAVLPGFYHAFGEAPADDLDRATQVRLYWNISHMGAPELVRTLTSTLNRWRIPFSYKCPVDRVYYARFDAGVLYVPGRVLPLLHRLIPEIAGAVETELDCGTPPFACRLRGGVAAAEDPAGGESFGMDRCGRVVDGLMEAFEKGENDVASRISRVKDRFEAAGLSWDAPWLNRRGVDSHGLEKLRL